MKAFLGIASVLWVVVVGGCMTAPTKPVTDTGTDPGMGDLLVDADLTEADEPGADRGGETADPGEDVQPSDVEDVGDRGLDLETDGVCNAWCGEAECGDDGCGGDCGTCLDGKVCQAGTCECLPKAEKRCCGQAVCWFDSCGTQGPKVVDCPNGCSGALCINCASQCEGKSCGPDGCGGDCGTCAPGSCAELVWTIAPACVDGACTTGGGTQDCDDGIACTRDTCDGVRGCGNWTAKDGATCIQGTCVSGVWTRPTTCQGGQCTQGGGTQTCTDGNPCTEDACYTEAGCTYTPNAEPCNDNDPCTTGDACSQGACGGTGTLACDDLNPCTTDRCETGVGCKTDNVENGTGCGSGTCNVLTFTPGSSCQTGVCTIGGGGPESCDDGKTCTVDSCDGTTGCRHQVIDGNCLIDGACQDDGATKGACLKCVAASSKTQWTVMDACDDGKECTTDSCDTGTGACKHDNLVDGADCGGGKRCRGGECTACVPQCALRTCGDDGCGGNCGTADCPVLAGYTVTCNAQQHCEYANSDTTGWKQHDVWIYVQPGSFTMGSPSTEAGHATDEEPQHAVTFAKGYLIGKYEVTVAQYEACGAGCTAPSTTDWNGDGWGTNSSTNGRASHPQNGLAWEQGAAACSWIGGRLPNESEWEYAATGPVHRKYPWGDAPEPDCSVAHFDTDGTWGRPWACNPCTTSGCSATDPVGTTPTPSWVGALDMDDGVREWVRDQYHLTYSGAPIDGSVWIDSGTNGVVRGGSYATDSLGMRVAARKAVDHATGSAYVGARCVRDLPPLACDGTTCPDLAGYIAYCNAQQHCEYANPDTTGWRQHDVWIYVQPGSFTMGSPSTEAGHATDEEPQHAVTFAKGYFIGKYEVTVGTYEVCATESPATCATLSTAGWDADGWGLNGSTNGRIDHPQDGLTFDQAGAVCAWLGGRLPSEAEWEFAATGPTHRIYPWGEGPAVDCDHAVFDLDETTGRPWGCEPCTTIGCSGTKPVGTKTVGVSASGCMDMSGNLWEWCQDWWHDRYTGAPVDGSAWTEPTGTLRVRRGGSFHSASSQLRTAARGAVTPGVASANHGARCVRDLPLTCGGLECPVLGGYKASCNAQAHCEYANADTTGWKQYDVWVHVPAGSFTMGSPSGESDHSSNEDPNHVVTFAKGYLIGKHEVTVEQYEACHGASPGTCTVPSTADWDGEGWGTNTTGNGRSTHPQNGLTWAQAGAVCSWLGGRRPSEAEWEYAATGPTHRKYPWGDSPEPDCTRAVFDSDLSGNRPWGCDSCTSSGCSGTKVVGSMAAGASWCGALDLSGNVWEWVEDWYQSTYSGAPTDGSAWVSPTGSDRVLRGGGFRNGASNLRSSYRGYGPPSTRHAYIGGRCLRLLP